MARESRDTEALGRVVRALRKEAGLTQEQLGRVAGLHPTYVSAVEGGLRNPSYHSLVKLVEGLGITWAEFGRALDEVR